MMHEKQSKPEQTATTQLSDEKLGKWMAVKHWWVRKQHIAGPALVGIGIFLFTCLLLDGNAMADYTARDPLAEKLKGLSPDSVTALYTSMPRRPFNLKDLNNHPDQAFPGLFPGDDPADKNRMVSNFAAIGSETYQKFSSLLNIFATRQGEDDNFTIRIMDKNDNTIEVVTLDSLKQVYADRGWMVWDEVDREREKIGRKIKERYRARGYAATDIQTRWGRKNQVLEARRREENLITYELRLAQRLGLSTLVTEIGTVETFNQDWLVSSVGARGRYQFMPSLLRTFDIEQYDIKNIQGGLLKVREERHPLLTMEASATLVRAYANAVGHEIPGVSAYHTGPGNIFKVYQFYLQNRTERMPTNSVAQAFIWGLTTGFPIVSRNSSFKAYSQGYVPSLYGSMRAVEKLRIDPAKMLRADLVQVSDGTTITLSDLLTVLENNGGKQMNWGYGTPNNTLYQRFRELNPHFGLPDYASDDVPQSGNLVLRKYASNGDRIRFFLPAGAADMLERIDPSILDERMTFRFDHTTFLDPVKTGEKTELDYEYDNLVSAIGRFGFTQENKDKLGVIANGLIQAALNTPTPFRRSQARIVRIHRDTWNSAEWKKLADAVSVAGITAAQSHRSGGFNF
ncbi:MAG: hypothetical protein JNN12_05565 [Bacteroidetes Order II. Incertae sedis bacterium]|nr:hypothetical protein [Bacteroidetes Order II. bacterium]